VKVKVVIAGIVDNCRGQSTLAVVLASAVAGVRLGLWASLALGAHASGLLVWARDVC